MSGDSLLTAFHDSCEVSNIGKLMMAAEVAAWPMVETSGGIRPIAKPVLQEALDSLNALSISDLPEDALRDVLVIEFESLIDTTVVTDSLQYAAFEVLGMLFPDSTFSEPTVKRGYTSGQVANLTAIAEECPSELGMAVYMARAMLSALDTIPYQYWHECEEVYLPPSEKRWEVEDNSNGLATFDRTVS